MPARLLTCLCAFALLLLATACGQRGPLYLEEPTPAEVGTPAAEDADENEEEDEESSSDEARQPRG